MSRLTAVPRFAAALLLGSVLFAAASVARAEEHDRAGWLVNEIGVPLGDRLSFHTMVQNRWTQDDRYERTVVRPWLAIDWPQGIELAVGYDLHSFDSEDRWEQRAWQRIAGRYRISRVDLLAHFWLEERFFEDASETAFRGRFNAGFRVDLGAGFSFLLRNEFFVDLNETDEVRRRGLGENQLVSTIGKDLPGGLHFQIGYMQQFLDRPKRDLFNHTLVTGFAWTTPALADWY